MFPKTHHVASTKKAPKMLATSRQSAIKGQHTHTYMLWSCLLVWVSGQSRLFSGHCRAIRGVTAAPVYLVVSLALLFAPDVNANKPSPSPSPKPICNTALCTSDWLRLRLRLQLPHLCRSIWASIVFLFAALNASLGFLVANQA